MLNIESGKDATMSIGQTLLVCFSIIVAAALLGRHNISAQETANPVGTFAVVADSEAHHAWLLDTQVGILRQCERIGRGGSCVEIKLK